MGRVDVLIVAALQEEFAATRDAALVGAPERGVARWIENDTDGVAPYLSGDYRTADGRTLSLALARPTRMGGRSTGPITTALTSELRPTCLAMCGVCAGNPGDAAPGDVVIAEAVYEWDEGKQTPSGFVGDHRQLLMDLRWMRVAQNFEPAGLPSHGAASEDEALQWLLERLHLGHEPREHPARGRFFPDGSWSERLGRFEADGWIARNNHGGYQLTEAGAALIKRHLYDNVDGPQHLPFAVQVAPMASGSAVVADAAIWDRLAAMGVRKIAAVEMEAATIATIAVEQRVPFWLIAKGVMDHADLNKDDRFKRFAARASAEVLYALLERVPFDSPGTNSEAEPEADVSHRSTLNAYLRSSPGPAVPAADEVGVSGQPPQWNVEPRNPGFAGRDDLLAEVHAELHREGAAVVQALRGMGGIGKTQLAIEYAYRNADDYDLVWWINAQQASLIGEQFGDLALTLGLVEAGADSPTAERVVKDHLRKRDRWLLIFDNAESEQDIRRWLPGGAGHVLITSRHHRWTEVAGTFEVDVFPRAESVELLTSHNPELTVAEAEAIAEAVGDLPLALVQATSFLAETGMSAADYCHALREEASTLLDEGRPSFYDHTVAAVVAISTEKLTAIDPAAMAVLHLCAFLAPEPVHPDLIAAMVTTSEAEPLPAALQPLARIIDKPLARQRSIGRIGTYGLAKITTDGVAVHRLVQAIVRDQLDPPDALELKTRIETVLGTANPGDPHDPECWPSWTRLMPHLLVADPAHTTNPALRQLARNGIVFMIVHGDIRPAQQLAHKLYETWRNTLSSDDPDTLAAATELVWAKRDLGELQNLRELVEDTLERQRVSLGLDHPDTLRSASDLAVILNSEGLPQLARQIDEDVLTRRRRQFGDDHRDTLTSAANLAITLRALGDYKQSRHMHQNVLDRRRRLLGDDHPDTHTSASCLANTLHDLGDYEQARDMQQDALDRRRRVLGEDHRDTLTSAASLASTLRALGDYEQARDMQQDALDRRRRVLGEDHPDTLTSAASLASTIRALGDYEHAHQMNQDVLNRRRRVLGEDHPHTLTSAASLASTLHALGDYEQAHQMHQDVLNRRRRVLGEDHPDAWISMVYLAVTEKQRRQLLAARRHADQAFKRLRAILGPDHPHTKYARDVLNRVRIAMGGRPG